MKKFLMASGLALLAASTLAQAGNPPAKYGQYCVACHATGAAGAPKTGDTEAWKPRMAAGLDAMVASTKAGKNAMPPGGLCPDCSDAEYRDIIKFMAGTK
jgi:cytochrome c5